MTEWLGIHEELHRLILRNRWVAWCDRDWRRRGCKVSKKALRRQEMLGFRLQLAKPTWEQRDEGRYDGAVP